MAASSVFFATTPLILAFLFALLWYPPIATGLVGWGEDPYFNLWTLEEVWKHLSAMGLGGVFSEQFWKLPILSSYPNTLAFSENQIFPALLSWPVRVLTQNGVLTYNLSALLMSLATFVFTALWLRSLGIQRLAVWGGLFFQACGWIQDQYAHYQNICIFVFPLAFYSWSRLLSKPTLLRALFCGVCFGWVMGWNVYYQIFLNLIFTFLAVRALIKKQLDLRQMGVLTITALVFEVPFALKYLELETYLGSLKVSTREFIQYSALPSSILARTRTISLLQKFLPNYPHFQVSIESVGFLGITWTALGLFSLFKNRSRNYILVALFFFWIALGPHYGLMPFVQIFPGFSGARAIGRLQVLVALFSLAGILLFLDKLRTPVQAFMIGLILLELFPSRPSFHAPEIAGFSNSTPTALETRLMQISPEQPILVLPNLTSFLQLSLSRVNNSLLQGYTGRTPFNAAILTQMQDYGISEQSVKNQLLFSKAQTVISFNEKISEKLENFTYLEHQGCYSHFNFKACLFSSRGVKLDEHSAVKRRNPPSRHENKPGSEAPGMLSFDHTGPNGFSQTDFALRQLLRLDLDTVWNSPSDRREPKRLENAQSQKDKQKSLLQATIEGTLDYSYTGQCWLEERLYLGPLQFWRNTHSLIEERTWSKDPDGSPRFEFKKGETILTQEPKAWLNRLPQWMRPRAKFKVACHKQPLN